MRNPKKSQNSPKLTSVRSTIGRAILIDMSGRISSSLLGNPVDEKEKKKIKIGKLISKFLF